MSLHKLTHVSRFSISVVFSGINIRMTLVLAMSVCFLLASSKILASDDTTALMTRVTSDTSEVQASTIPQIEQSKNPSFPLSDTQIRTIMRDAIDAFYTPSVSLAIVYKGQLIFTGAEGYRDIEKKLAANEDTYYRLASTSKAFTAAAIAILVDQGKLSWQDRVIDHLPNFQMRDPWVTREFTIKDLLSHRSGLVSAAGDSMIWPEPSGFSRDEVIHNLRYLTPEYSFRSQYAYSNVMYITAGELIAKVSQQPFEEFIDEHLFSALGMNCYAGDLSAEALSNVATPYGHNNTQGLYPIPRNSIHGKALMSAAAGGMVCNVKQMSKWMHALLDTEKLPFSGEQLSHMWSSQTILNVSNLEEEWDGTLFKTYGLGWRLSNLFEHRVISHTGTLSGYQAYISLIPDFELGVIVLNNGSNYGVRGAVMQSIIKAVLAEEKNELTAQNWIKNYQDYQSERETAYLARDIKTPKGSKSMSITNKQIVGRYTDQWFGDFAISNNSENKQKLRIAHNKMQTLKGDVVSFEGLSYMVEWDDKNAQNDAFLHFDIDHQGHVIGMKMHPFTTQIRRHHEYKDMHFIKQ